MPTISLRSTISDAGTTVNDDCAGCNETAAWVIDGATGMTDDRLLPGPSDARWLSNVLSESYDLLTRKGITGDELFRVLHSLIAQRFSENLLQRSVLDRHLPAAAFSSVQIENAAEVSLFNIGDCILLYRSGSDSVKRFGSSEVEFFDEKVLSVLKDGIKCNRSYDDCWPEMKTQIIKNRKMANSAGGYWVVDPTDRWLEQIQSMTIEIEYPFYFVLMSDGMSRLFDTYNYFLTEDELFGAVLNRADSLVQILRSIESEDTKCTNHPRIKPSDDATLLVGEITQS